MQLGRLIQENGSHCVGPKLLQSKSTSKCVWGDEKYMRMSRAAVVLILALGFYNLRAYGQAVATWTDSSGNWSNSGNWSTCAPAACPAVPSNGGGTFYNVVINGTGSDTITFDASGTTVNSLTIGAGETFQDNGLAPTLTIGDPAFPAAGSLTNGGTINWGNGSNLTLDMTAGNGSITNSGAINLTSSTLTFSDSGNGNMATLSGGGTVKLSGGTITGSFGDETLTNSNNIIQGSGTISNLTLVNNGTINANAVGALTITPNSGGFTNSGTVNVTGLGGLVINAGATPVTNGGTMNINSSNLTVRGAFAQGIFGALTLQNGSVGTIAGNFVSEFSGLSMDDSVLTVQGNYTCDDPNAGCTNIRNGGRLAVQGTLNNVSASILYATGGSSVTVSGEAVNYYASMELDRGTMIVQGNFTNVDEGWIDMQNGSTMAVDGTFTNGGEGEGEPVAEFESRLKLIGPGNAASLYAVQNYTLIAVDAGSSLTVTGGGFTNNSGATLNLGGSLSTTGGFTNSGGSVLMSATATFTTDSYSQSAGLTDVSGTLVANSYTQSGGNTTIESGGLLTATTFKASGGSVTVNGVLDPVAVEIDSGATLQGAGSITGNVAMAGTIMPGSASGPGTLTIVGNYEQIGNGVFDELIGGASYNGLLDVTGNVALDSDSQLEITLLGGFNPIGDSFTIMDYNSLAGQFSNGSSFWDNGYLWDISYGQNQIDVTAVQAPEPSSFLLLLIGLAALAFYAHRKMAKTQRLA